MRATIYSSRRDECIHNACIHNEYSISYEIHITWRIDEARATLRQRSEAVGQKGRQGIESGLETSSTCRAINP